MLIGRRSQKVTQASTLCAQVYGNPVAGARNNYGLGDEVRSNPVSSNDRGSSTGSTCVNTVA